MALLVSLLTLQNYTLTFNVSIPAVSSMDYVSLNTMLTLSGSVSRACVNISIVMDGNSESDESFSIIISSMDSAIDLRPSMADVTIQDSDCE